MTWLPRTVPAETPLDAVFGLCPEAYARFRELYGELWRAPDLDPAIVDLCRLRTAVLLGCEAELSVRHAAADAAGATEEKRAQLAQWPTSPAFSELERACLAFAEQYALDPHGVTDEQTADLCAALGERGLASLTLALAMSDALVRFRLALGVAPAAGGAEVALEPGAPPRSLP